MVIPTLKTCYFEASEDIMTKFKSQALHIIRIKHWKASGSGNPPSLIPALQKIAILGLKTKFYILFCTRLYVNQFAYQGLSSSKLHCLSNKSNLQTSWVVSSWPQKGFKSRFTPKMYLINPFSTRFWVVQSGSKIGSNGFGLALRVKNLGHIWVGQIHLAALLL